MFDSDVEINLALLFMWCVDVYDALTIDIYHIRKNMPFTEDELSEFSAFVREVADKTSCIVELPFDFKGFTLACKTCDSSYSLDNESFMKMVKPSLDVISGDDSYSDQLKDWASEVVDYAAPIESFESWTQFFNMLQHKLEKQPIRDRFLRIFTWWTRPMFYSFQGSIMWEPMECEEEARVRLTAFLEHCFYRYYELIECRSPIKNDHYFTRFSILVKEAADEASCIVKLPFYHHCFALECKPCNCSYSLDVHSFDREISYYYRKYGVIRPEKRIWSILALARKAADQCAATPEALKVWSQFFDILHHKLKSNPNPVNESFLDACWRDKTGWARFYKFKIAFGDISEFGTYYN